MLIVSNITSLSSSLFWVILVVVLIWTGLSVCLSFFLLPSIVVILFIIILLFWVLVQSGGHSHERCEENEDYFRVI
jgi:cytosine/uracil/thiamine/allantoin permease